MRIAAVVAMAENRVIGRHNQLPWQMPADLQHFKKVTMGKPIIMGRKTYQSIGRPLPGRCNIVVTHDTDFLAPGCVVVNSVSNALEASSGNDEIFIIGGALLFEHLLPQIERIYMTVIHHEIDGDAYFPALTMSEWVEHERSDHQADVQNAYDYSFITYDRV